MKYLSNLVIYVGYVFLGLVSVAGAFREENVIWRWLLFASEDTCESIIDELV